MGALFIFIFISALVISALLFFNKGEKAQEIKSILKDIFENFRELFSNLKKLFLILKDLIQTKLDNNPIQLKEESSTEIELPSEESTPDADSKTEVIADQEIPSTSEVTPSTQEINPNMSNSTPIKANEPELISSEVDSPEDYSNHDEEIDKNN